MTDDLAVALGWACPFVGLIQIKPSLCSTQGVKEDVWLCSCSLNGCMLEWRSW